MIFFCSALVLLTLNIASSTCCHHFSFFQREFLKIHYFDHLFRMFPYILLQSLESHKILWHTSHVKQIIHHLCIWLRHAQRITERTDRMRLQCRKPHAHNNGSPLVRLPVNHGCSLSTVCWWRVTLAHTHMDTAGSRDKSWSFASFWCRAFQFGARLSGRSNGEIGGQGKTVSSNLAGVRP